MKDNVYFVTGIGTDIGKTYATAWLASKWQSEGLSVTTQKFIQTGCTGLSEDVLTHRRLMGENLTEDDLKGETCGQMFSFPASIHFAARLDSKEVDLEQVEAKMQRLAGKYDRLLVEGAGGIMVPIREDCLTIDYLKQRRYRIVFVTNPFLGSINHSLLSFYAMKQANLRLDTLIFNFHGRDAGNAVLEEDSFNIISDYAKRMFGVANIFRFGTMK